jgi:hypothetical protein
VEHRDDPTIADVEAVDAAPAERAGVRRPRLRGSGEGDRGLVEQRLKTGHGKLLVDTSVKGV